MSGHLRQRGGSWELVAYAGRDPLTGKRKYVSRSFRGLKREAQAALDRLVVEVSDGVEGGSVGTVGELLDRYIEVFGPSWSPSTLRQAVSVIERHLRPRWGEVLLRRVAPVDIDRFYAELHRRGGQGGKPLSSGTVTRVHSIFRAALEQAVRWGLLGQNPASRASPPRSGESEVRPPSPAELGRLLDAAAEDDLEFWTYLRLAASSGARRSQICGLRWCDLDLVAGMATFARAVVDGLDGIVVKDGKTHRAYVVALDAATVDVLRRHLQACQERAALCGASLADRGFVLSFDPDGTRPWRPDTVTHRFSRLRKKVGLPAVRLHDLRHYVATRLLAGGVPISTVAGRLGHARASTTLNVYSHFVPATDRVAADLLASLLTTSAGSEPAARRRAPVVAGSAQQEVLVLLSVHAPEPEARTAALVRHGHDQDMVVAHDVREVVREPLDPHPPSMKVSPDALDRGASARPARDRADCSIDCSEEGEAKAFVTVLVPRRSVPEVFVRLACEGGPEASPGEFVSDPLPDRLPRLR